MKQHRAVLQHIRETVVRQQGGRSECSIDPEASLEEIPGYVLEEFRAEGLTLATGDSGGGDS